MRLSDKVYVKPLAQYLGYHKHSINGDLTQKTFPDQSSKIKPKSDQFCKPYLGNISEKYFQKIFKTDSLELLWNGSGIQCFKYMRIEHPLLKVYRILGITNDIHF